jgi:spore coat polysaccharide biosynthesis protein SpsF
MTRTVAIIQARMGSTRLPGKVLLPLLDEPLLAHVVRRVSRARSVDATVVATTMLPADDVIVELGRRQGWIVERGSENDLLDRYLRAAQAHAAEIVVRVTSDCPLIDPTLIDDVVDAFRAGRADYASNTLPPRTYPRGLDVEVISMDALERAARDDHDPAWREHATPYIYRHPDQFRLLRVAGPEDHGELRWTVDTPEDLAFVRRIFAALPDDSFGWRAVLDLLAAHPDWADINRMVAQKVVPDGGTPPR